jgi:hypothetical protein
MATAQITGGLTNAAVQRGLNSPNKYNFIADFHQQSYNYSRVTEILSSYLNTKSYGVATADLTIGTQVMDSVTLYSNITSSVSDGGTGLVLTLSEGNGELYRLNFTVLNKTGQKQAIVYARTANTISIRPTIVNGTTETLTAGTDFPSGTVVAEGSQLVQDRASGAQQGRKVIDRIVEDYLRTYRANRFFARTDYAKTFIDEALRSGDSAMLQSALVQLQVDDLAVDMMTQMEKGFIFDKMGIQMIGNEESRTQMGFLQAVDERGGIPINSNVPMTFNKMNEISLDVYNNYNAKSNEIIALVGSKAKARIIEDGQLYKYTAGTTSVLKDQLNANSIAFDNWRTGFGSITMIDCDLFNDINIMPNVSNTGYTNLQESALFFSTTQMKGKGGSPIPLIQDYHGSYGGNPEGIAMSYTKGIVGKDGKFETEAFSQLDGVELGQIAHTAKVIANAQPCGYFMYQG